MSILNKMNAFLLKKTNDNKVVYYTASWLELDVHPYRMDVFSREMDVHVMVTQEHFMDSLHFTKRF